MNFSDLIDEQYNFECKESEDACEYWDYDFSIKILDERYLMNISPSELNHLRKNCKEILQATDHFQGGE